MDMKKVVVLMCVVLMGAGTFAYTFMGPPTAELEMTRIQKETPQPYKPIKYNQRENNVGYIYSFSKQAIDVDGLGTVDDAEITRHYFTWGIAHLYYS
ncbi:MAG: hypothetical protein ISS71_09390 [Phycisphaerae bacterium]|nr:hypothetical protein [Phycisphaerae bacterium]